MIFHLLRELLLETLIMLFRSGKGQLLDVLLAALGEVCDVCSVV